jgi:hypothetical protein
MSLVSRRHSGPGSRQCRPGRPGRTDRHRRVGRGRARPAPLRRGADVRDGHAGRSDEFSGCGCCRTRKRPIPAPAPRSVVVGDAGDDFTPRNIQSAFTAAAGWGPVRGDAQEPLVADAGRGRLSIPEAYVVALEYVTQRRALVVGKPSRPFFAEGVRRLDEMVAAASSAAPGKWRWSATISGTTFAAARRPGCAESSSGRASTATRNWLARATAERGRPRAGRRGVVDLAEVVAALAD